jgi:murein L,D-transpeptidase YcbB/YkuD
MLDRGVRSFQTRFGLRADGIIGAGMMRALNAPLSMRIRQIVVNMERTRWMSAEPAGDHLVINIPQFELLVYRGDSLQWSCPVVVGKDANKTAIFQADMKYIVFSPWWNVPASILEKEILPALARNPAYLRQNELEWQGKSLRQRPGEGVSACTCTIPPPNPCSGKRNGLSVMAASGCRNRADSHCTC